MAGELRISCKHRNRHIYYRRNRNGVYNNRHGKLAVNSCSNSKPDREFEKRIKTVTNEQLTVSSRIAVRKLTADR